MSQADLASQCPYCRSRMRPVAMACSACGCEIRGTFPENLFALLSPDERTLLEVYLLSGFSIKALSESTGLGYFALRNRIDRLIESYRSLMQAEEQTKAILRQVETGEIAVSEAVDKIREL